MERGPTRSSTRKSSPFGAGANETPPNRRSRRSFARTLRARLFASRQRDGAHIDPLYHMQSERPLRIHPANLPDLRYFSPEVEWELIALGKHWRHELKIVFHKRNSDAKV